MNEPKPETENAVEEPKAEPGATTSSDANELLQLKNDLERFKDLALRGQADFENYRKRATREKEEAIKFANVSFLEKLVPIFDNLELGMAAAEGDNANSAVMSGLKMVAKQLQDFLSDQGVKPIDAVGKKFDPNLHEAIAQEPSSEVAEGHVTRQLRKGYKIKDRLLRPSNVVVSKGDA